MVMISTLLELDIRPLVKFHITSLSGWFLIVFFAILFSFRGAHKGLKETESCSLSYITRFQQFLQNCPKFSKFVSIIYTKMTVKGTKTGGNNVSAKQISKLSNRITQMQETEKHLANKMKVLAMAKNSRGMAALISYQDKLLAFTFRKILFPELMKNNKKMTFPGLRPAYVVEFETRTLRDVIFIGSKAVVAVTPDDITNFIHLSDTGTGPFSGTFSLTNVGNQFTYLGYDGETELSNIGVVVKTSPAGEATLAIGGNVKAYTSIPAYLNMDFIRKGYINSAGDPVSIDSITTSDGFVWRGIPVLSGDTVDMNINIAGTGAATSSNIGIYPTWVLDNGAVSNGTPITGQTGPNVFATITAPANAVGLVKLEFSAATVAYWVSSITADVSSTAAASPCNLDGGSPVGLANGLNLNTMIAAGGEVRCVACELTVKNTSAALDASGKIGASYLSATHSPYANCGLLNVDSLSETAFGDFKIGKNGCHVIWTPGSIQGAEFQPITNKVSNDSAFIAVALDIDKADGRSFVAEVFSSHQVLCDNQSMPGITCSEAHPQVLAMAYNAAFQLPRVYENDTHIQTILRYVKNGTGTLALVAHILAGMTGNVNIKAVSVLANSAYNAM